MYVMPLGPAASLVGVWHRGQRHQPWLESPAFHRRFRVKQTHNEPGSQMQLPSLSLFVHEVTSDLWWSLMIFGDLCPFDAFDVRCFLRRHHSHCSQWHPVTDCGFSKNGSPGGTSCHQLRRMQAAMLCATESFGSGPQTLEKCAPKDPKGYPKLGFSPWFWGMMIWW